MSSLKKSSKLIIFSVVFIDLLGFGVLIPMIPFIGRHLGADAYGVGWLMAIYSLMQFFVSPFWGRLSDRWGRRPVLILTIAGQALAFFAGGLSTTYQQFFFSRLFAGLFAANISTASAYMADITQPAERAKGMGLIGAAFGLGFIFGPAIGAILIPYGYEWPSFFAGAVSLFNLGWALLVLAEPATDSRIRSGNRRKLSLSLLKETFANARLRIPIFLFFILTLAFVQLEITFGLFVLDRFSISGRGSGLLLAGMGVMMALVQGGGIGKLVARHGEKKIIGWGFPLIALGLMGLIVSPNLWLLVLSLMILAIGYSMTNPCLSALTSKAAGSDRQGMVLGVYQSGGSIARVVGPPLAGFLYDRSMIGAFCGGLILSLIAKMIFTWTIDSNN